MLSFKEANIYYVCVVIKIKRREKSVRHASLTLIFDDIVFRTVSGEYRMFAKASPTLNGRL